MSKLTLRDLFTPSVFEPKNDQAETTVEMLPAFWLGMALFYSACAYAAGRGREEFKQWVLDAFFFDW
jgi:hypothetical protein